MKVKGSKPDVWSHDGTAGIFTEEEGARASRSSTSSGRPWLRFWLRRWPARPIRRRGPWRPPQDPTWYWQLQGTVGNSHPEAAYHIDGFDNSAREVAALHAAGKHVILLHRRGHLGELAQAGTQPLSTDRRCIRASARRARRTGSWVPCLTSRRTAVRSNRAGHYDSNATAHRVIVLPIL